MKPTRKRAAFFVAVSVAIAMLNSRAARKLQRQIDELQQAGGES
jgi:hypothetical protein